MKRIINGQRYDTDKAKLVAERETDLPRSDFRWAREELYRTPRGRWFVAGRGHGMTRWARVHDDGMRGMGEGIVAMTPEEAREWLEAEEDTAAVERYFGDAVEDA